MDLEQSLTQIGGMPWQDKIAYLVRELGHSEQVECPLKHAFAPGVYLREIFMPAGTVVIGKIHKTEHFNLIDKGSCILFHPDGRHEKLTAPMTFVSKAGVQKVLFILEDTTWRTIHPTPERDLQKLETELIEAADYPCFDRTEERKAIEEAAA
jgi:hypothetical protein